MKLFMLLGLISVAHCLSDTTSLATSFCDMSNLCRPGKKSVACKIGTNLAMNCVGEMVPIDQNLVLSIHNKYRQDICNGVYPPFPKATNMAEMVYSEELAMLASYNTRKCKYGHDDCRSTTNFPHAGQNIALSKSQNSAFNFTATITTLMQSWFNEYKVCDLSYIQKFRTPVGPDVGHFTQIIKATATQIGCSAVTFNDGKRYNFYLVCDYGYGNMLGEPVYIQGNVAGSDCINPSTSYSGLCAP